MSFIELLFAPLPAQLQPFLPSTANGLIGVKKMALYLKY